MLFQVVQMLFWLALSCWLGSALAVMLAYPIIFRTVKENNPILSHVLSVNLDSQHSVLLAGTIMYNLVSRLLQVELICAAVLLVALVGQTLLINLGGDRLVPAIIRSVLYLLAVGMALYDWHFVWPEIQSSRTEYIDHADEPEIANAALDRFDRAQRKSFNLLAVVVMLLMGMVLFSSTFTIEVVQKVAK